MILHNPDMVTFHIQSSLTSEYCGKHFFLISIYKFHLNTYYSTSLRITLFIIKKTWVRHSLRNGAYKIYTEQPKLLPGRKETTKREARRYQNQNPAAELEHRLSAIPRSTHQKSNNLAHLQTKKKICALPTVTQINWTNYSEITSE